MDTEFRCSVCLGLIAVKGALPVDDVCDSPDCQQIARDYEESIVVWPIRAETP